MSATVHKSPIALDIETVGRDWESLPSEVQEYLLGRAKSDAKREEVPERLALHPGTGRVIAIGIWHPDSGHGRVFLEGSPSGWTDFDAGIKILRGNEETLLKEFWGYVGESASTVITFSGRQFDGPYLMIRSVILGIEPTRNLLPYRYSFRDHCDLAEVLSFWNARRVDGNLDFWCRQFGLDSPKTNVHGGDVGALYKAGRLEDIARYCLGDVRATAQLYVKLKPIINLLNTENSR